MSTLSRSNFLLKKNVNRPRFNPEVHSPPAVTEVVRFAVSEINSISCDAKVAPEMRF